MVAALELMTQRGLVVRESGAWKLRVPLKEIALEVPSKLRQLIETQIDRLTPVEHLGYLSHSLAFCLHGGSQGDRDIYVMINAYREDLNFKIQEGKAGDWLCVADTGMSSPSDFFDAGQEKALSSMS